MRLLVTGGRNYTDTGEISRVLNALDPDVVIHGEAPGADYLCGVWGKRKGKKVIGEPANWALGHSAGYLRNQRMLHHHPDLVVAFPGGRGTQDMVHRARKAGVPVLLVAADYPRVGS
jgi:hypothetical protein